MEGPVHNQKPSLEKIKDWIKISALIGASFLAGKIAIETHKYIESEERAQYLRSEYLMSEDEIKTINNNLEEIREHFGQRALDNIINGDRAALLEKKDDAEKEVDYVGFENAGLTKESVQKFVSEETFFPKNFINGEIRGFYFSDSDQHVNSEEQGVLIKDKEAGNLIAIFLKKADSSVNDVDKIPLLFYIKYICSHEIGHANDWETDKQANIKERIDLLNKIRERLNSEDRLQTYDAKILGAWEYYESKENVYDKAQEYWAELCKEYFSNPEYLKQNFPTDFEIINNFVLKQDPNFDTFKVSGPYFRADTGELSEKWQEFAEDAINPN